MKFGLSVLLLSALSFIQSAAALTISCGPAICYEYDETQGAIALFGQPYRVGDSMQFLPEAFAVSSVNGAGPFSTSASFTFSRVYTLNGADIDSLSVEEEGDYRILGGGSVAATLGLTLTVVSYNVLGESVPGESAITSSTFVQSDPSGALKPWTQSVTTRTPASLLFWYRTAT